jgi:hypothetical protein
MFSLPIESWIVSTIAMIIISVLYLLRKNFTHDTRKSEEKAD